MTEVAILSNNLGEMKPFPKLMCPTKKRKTLHEQEAGMPQKSCRGDFLAGGLTCLLKRSANKMHSEDTLSMDRLALQFQGR